ncbi:hypothetical protein FJSC11DRAFT_3751 [Fischerella thermalis JSC-11]|jgi:hypothetical protein|uniref:Uncharacterized protein n=1 Tax=Fischerella thermalis JSC-11 TaxID=741277 RepID=G6FY02_9CYAN|nr:hypothetical protein FJSC11DRAFT_3751 [Fischerella thermalis JSC-11]
MFATDNPTRLRHSGEGSGGVLCNPCVVFFFQIGIIPSSANCSQYYALVLVIGFFHYQLPITYYQPTRQYKYFSEYDIKQFPVTAVG